MKNNIFSFMFGAVEVDLGIVALVYIMMTIIGGI